MHDVISGRSASRTTDILVHITKLYIELFTYAISTRYQQPILIEELSIHRRPVAHIHKDLVLQRREKSLRKSHLVILQWRYLTEKISQPMRLPMPIAHQVIALHMMLRQETLLQADPMHQRGTMTRNLDRMRINQLLINAMLRQITLYSGIEPLLRNERIPESPRQPRSNIYIDARPDQ